MASNWQLCHGEADPRCFSKSRGAPSGHLLPRLMGNGYRRDLHQLRRRLSPESLNLGFHNQQEEVNAQSPPIRTRSLPKKNYSLRVHVEGYKKIKRMIRRGIRRNSNGENSTPQVGHGGMGRGMGFSRRGRMLNRSDGRSGGPANSRG